MAGPGLTTAHLNTCVTHGETYRGVSLYTRAWCWVCTCFCIRRGRKSCDEGPYGELRAELSYFLLVSQPTLRSRSGTHHWAVSLVTLPLSHGCSDILLNKWPGLVFSFSWKKISLKKKKSVCGWVCACEYSVHCGGRVGCRGFPRAGVTGRCELPGVGARNSIQVLCKSHLLSLCFLLAIRTSFVCLSVCAVAMEEVVLIPWGWSCELPDFSSRNWIQIFRKSLHLSLWAISTASFCLSFTFLL